MKYASSDYKDNAYGMSGVRQYLRDKKKPKEEKDQEVNMNCSADHGCAAYDSGGGGSNAGSSSYKGGGSSSGGSGTGGEANKVLTKKQADKRAKEFEENRKKAAARNLRSSDLKQDRLKF